MTVDVHDRSSGDADADVSAPAGDIAAPDTLTGADTESRTARIDTQSPARSTDDTVVHLPRSEKGGRRKILVADGGEGPREALGRLLRAAGHEVALVADVAATLETFDRLEPQVVLLDADLPRGGGLDALRELKQRAPLAQVILLARHGSRETAALAREYGAVGYLSKPFQSDELLRTVDEALRAPGPSAAPSRAPFRPVAVPDGPPALQPMQALFPELVASLRKRGTLGVLYLDASTLNDIEERYGFEVFDGLLESFHQRAQQAAQEIFGGGAQPALLMDHDDGLLIFLTANPAGGAVAPEMVEAAVQRLRMHVLPRLMSMCLPYHAGPVELRVGHCTLVYRPLIRPERLVLRGVEEARRACATKKSALERRREEIMEILVEGRITSLYQPIVGLADRSVMGWEALSRGPRETEYESPARLFEAFREVQLTPGLDRLCRLTALAGAAGMPAGRKLFVNVLPTAVADPDFRSDEEAAFIAAQGLSPSDVVLELSESVHIGNSQRFRRNIAQLRERGFGIAIDDAGTGYSNLVTISEVKPDYLKIDMSLVRSVDRDPLRRAVLETFQQLASRIDAQVVTEGIESEAEFETLRALGIEYGQGYYFAAPGAGLVGPEDPDGAGEAA